MGFKFHIYESVKRIRASLRVVGLNQLRTYNKLLSFETSLNNKLEAIMATAEETKQAAIEARGKVQELTAKFLEFDGKLDALKDDPVALDAARAEMRAIVDAVNSAFAAADASEQPQEPPVEG